MYKIQKLGQMKLKTQSSSNQLPIYHLEVVDGKYPFKNAYISRIFDVKVHQIITMKDNPNLNKIVNIFNQEKNPLLVSFLDIAKERQQNLKISFQYVQTPLGQYIRRYVNQNIQLKMQNLLVMLRDLVYKFITKKINIVDGIAFNNFGVKMVDRYRQSLAVQPKCEKKQLILPDFKVFIDLSKCKYVERLEDVGRLIIETDKRICMLFRENVDVMIENAIKQHQEQFKQFHQKEKKKLTGNLSLSRLDIIQEDKDLQFKKKTKQIDDKGLSFTQKRRKMRKRQGKAEQQVIQKEKQIVKSTTTMMISSLKDHDNNLDVMSTKSIRSSLGGLQKNPVALRDENLKNKIDKLVERSRRNLKVFRDRFIENVT